MSHESMLLLCLTNTILLSLGKAQEASYGFGGDGDNHFIYPAASSAPADDLVFQIGDIVILEWATTSLNYSITLNQDGPVVRPGPIVFMESGAPCA